MTVRSPLGLLLSFAVTSSSRMTLEDLAFHCARMIPAHRPMKSSNPSAAATRTDGTDKSHDDHKYVDLYAALVAGPMFERWWAARRRRAHADAR